MSGPTGAESTKQTADTQDDEQHVKPDAGERCSPGYWDGMSQRPAIALGKKAASDARRTRNARGVTSGRACSHDEPLETHAEVEFQMVQGKQQGLMEPNGS